MRCCNPPDIAGQAIIMRRRCNSERHTLKEAREEEDHQAQTQVDIKWRDLQITDEDAEDRVAALPRQCTN